ncbi:hypothetical protein CU044_5153 [Streptomyces sp. L-9-10]|nr:hypothetical protein CU044_5153 [Streptomyces sp. L-9-10]
MGAPPGPSGHRPRARSSHQRPPVDALSCCTPSVPLGQS